MRLFHRSKLPGAGRRPAKHAVSLAKNASARLDDAGPIENPKAASLLEYWHRNRQDGALPDRTTFEATRLAEWLGFLSIYQYEAGPDDFRNRLEGSYVADLTGENWTGRYASDVDRRFGSSFRAELAEVRVRETPVADLVQIYQNDYGVAVRLLLPVALIGGREADQIFVALFARNYQPPQVI